MRTVATLMLIAALVISGDAAQRVRRTKEDNAIEMITR